METNQEVQRWEDIVFENRNKSYGAYAIRKGYNENVLRSGMFCMLVLGFALFITKPSPQVIEKIINGDRPGPTLTEIRQTDIIIEKQPYEPPPKHSSKGFAFTPTTKNVSDDTTAVTSAVPASMGNDTDSTAIRTDYVDPGTGASDPPVTPTQPWVIGAEVMPSYEGGISEMMKFLKSKLRYPSRPSRMGIEGTVYVSFVVGKDGSVGYIEVIKGVDSDLDREAIRVISMMNGWKSGMQDKMPVAVKMVLPIKFSLGR